MRINATQLWATGFSLSGNVDISPVAAIDESTATQGPLVHDRTVVHDQAAPVPGRNDVRRDRRPRLLQRGPDLHVPFYKKGGRAAWATVSSPERCARRVELRRRHNRALDTDIGRAPEAVVISTATASTAEVRQLTVSVAGNGFVVMIRRRPLPRRRRYGADLLRPRSLSLLRAARAPAAGDAAGPSPGSLLPVQQVDRGMRRTGAELHRRGHRPEHGDGRVPAQGSRRRGRPQRPLAQLLRPLGAWRRQRRRRGARKRGARRSRLTLQVRRPGGGPAFLFKYLTASGAFVQKLSLGPGEFPPGAQLFPGGFVVSVTGTTGGFQLPLQLKTVVLRSPSEGVVRQAFPSAREPREWCAASLPARDEGGVGQLPLRHAAAQAATPVQARHLVPPERQRAGHGDEGEPARGGELPALRPGAAVGPVDGGAPCPRSELAKRLAVRIS